MNPPHNLHRIAVGEIPSEGKAVSGTLEEDIFSLRKGEPQVSAPLVYDLIICRYDNLILATGSLQTTFSLRCVRCLNEFPYRVELRGHSIEVELEGEEMIDLTESIREDVLLSLPGYPRCEDSFLDSVVCDPGVKLYSANNPPPEAADDQESLPDKQNVWGALDNLESLHDND